MFGEVERGFEALDQFLLVGMDSSHRPLVRLTVNRAEVVESAAALANVALTPATSIQIPSSTIEAGFREMKLSVIFGFLCVLVLCLMAAWFSQRGDSKRARALAIASALIAGISAFSVAAPLFRGELIFAPLVVAALLFLFRVMGRFELGG